MLPGHLFVLQSFRLYEPLILTHPTSTIQYGRLAPQDVPPVTVQVVVFGYDRAASYSGMPTTLPVILSAVFQPLAITPPSPAVQEGIEMRERQALPCGNWYPTIRDLSSSAPQPGPSHGSLVPPRMMLEKSSQVLPSIGYSCTPSLSTSQSQSVPHNSWLTSLLFSDPQRRNSSPQCVGWKALASYPIGQSSHGVVDSPHAATAVAATGMLLMPTTRMNEVGIVVPAVT